MLDCFTIETSRWRTSALAGHCGLPVPTVHRILAVLESFDYVTRDPVSREYQLGPAAAGLGHRSHATPILREIALPVLHSIRSATHERAILAIAADARGHGIEVVGRAPDAIAVDGHERLIERSGPLHAGAHFKALLAHLPREQIEAVIEAGLERSGPAAITDPRLLRADLAAIRRRGWAISREEVAAQRWAVAVPVLDDAGRPACALGVAASLDRLDLDLARHHLAVLERAARTVAGRLADDSAARAGSERTAVA